MCTLCTSVADLILLKTYMGKKKKPDMNPIFPGRIYTEFQIQLPLLFNYKPCGTGSTEITDTIHL